MQKSFALRAKRVIKRVTSLGVGIGMLTASLGGALAADPTLADYPSPFTGSDGIIVIGSSADSAAAADIALGLPKTTITSDGKIEGGITADVPLGLGISNSTSVGFDWEVGHNQVSSFLKGKINFQSSDYDAHDEVVLSRNTPNVATSLSSRTALQQDYEDNVFLEVGTRGSVGYYYVFDDGINISKATSAKPLEIKFLGKTLKITDVSTSDTTKFTAYITNQYFMNVGDTVTIEGKKVKLENVGSTGALLVSVDGVIDTIASSSDKVINGIEVANDQTFYDANDKNQRAATLFIGKNALNTYKDGDAFIGENENDPQWVWDTASLAESSSTSVTQGAPGNISVSGPRLGLLNDFLRQSASQNPAGVGECIDLPNKYASICLDGLTVPATDYLTMTIELAENEPTSRSGQAFGGDAQNTIKFTAAGDQRFIIKANSLTEDFNSTVDRKTSKIWIAAKNVTLEQNYAVYYFDADKSPTMQFAGVIGLFAGHDLLPGGGYSDILGEGKIFEISYGSTKENNVNVTLGNDGTSVNTTLFIRLQQNADSSTAMDTNADIIRINVSVASEGGNFSSIGATKSREEAGELVWGPLNTTGVSSVVSIGDKGVNLRTRYGTIIKDPKANGASDKVVVAIPSDIVKAKVSIKGVAVSSPSAGGTSSNTMNADQITDLTQYNAILVGGPCANSHTAKIMGSSTAWPDCANGFTQGEAMLALKANGSKWALVVAGYSADDTRRAAIALKSYSVDGAGKPIFLTGTSKTVKGTSLEVSGLTVV